MSHLETWASDLPEIVCLGGGWKNSMKEGVLRISKCHIKMYLTLHLHINTPRNSCYTFRQQGSFA